MITNKGFDKGHSFHSTVLSKAPWEEFHRNHNTATLKLAKRKQKDNPKKQTNKRQTERKPLILLK